MTSPVAFEEARTLPNILFGLRLEIQDAAESAMICLIRHTSLRRLEKKRQTQRTDFVIRAGNKLRRDGSAP